MKVLVSACLLGEDCKYSGGNNRDERVVVTARDGRVVDAEFRRGAALALERAREEGAGLAILQPRSPSCGVRQIYDGTFSGRRIDGQGVFARLLLESGFSVVEPEDLA